LYPDGLDVLKVCMNVKGGLCCPEFQFPSGMQFGLQLPDVVECRPLDHTHVTVSPAVMVVMLVPLTESTN
jgi:hypothetical protein